MTTNSAYQFMLDGVTFSLSDRAPLPLKNKTNAQLADVYNQMCNAEVSKGVLGQTLTTEAGAHGGNGRGLGKVHQDEQKLWLEYDACEMGETGIRIERRLEWLTAPAPSSSPA
jgi:hypothetical protein